LVQTVFIEARSLEYRVKENAKARIAMFKNREEAGKQLAKAVQIGIARLPQEPGQGTIVVGLPRGGVPVAKEVAALLNVPLTILVSKKVGAPGQPELALGAVSSSGTASIYEELCATIPEIYSYLNREIPRMQELTKELESKWLHAAGLPKRSSFAGKRVIIVDDGIATGMTTSAAIAAVEAELPASVLVATPVVARNSRNRLLRECDTVISLLSPNEFWAVGQFYEDFHQVEDSEMIAALKTCSQGQTA
jgi:putative phosphoribosyl transferase